VCVGLYAIHIRKFVPQSESPYVYGGTQFIYLNLVLAIIFSAAIAK
jgi:hypothetical protein